MAVNTELLQLEKIREDIATELARRHNWKQQEEHWQRMQENWANEQKMTRARVFIAIAAVAAAFGGIAVKLIG